MLYNADCIEVLKTIEPSSIDLIFADPPYFLSNGGKSIKSGQIVSVNKGAWDDKKNYTNHLEFTANWINLCHKVLKPGGSIWISGTMHNIFDIRKYLLDAGFKIINLVIWHKTDPPPLIYRNKLKFSYEFIIWASKGYNHSFNYEQMYAINNQELEDVWTIPAVQMSEKTFGYHPTQKPEALLARIIEATSKLGDIVLDPFMGSGTTCFVAKKLKRKYIGIEKDAKFFNISKRRIESI